MKITLAHRHYGLHKHVKETDIPGQFSDYATPKPEADPDDYTINEDKLLKALPDDFLPVPANRILLTVEDVSWSTGQVGLTRFRNWAKYFDAYCLNLPMPENPSERTAKGGA